MKVENLAGRRFGKLLVTGFYSRNPQRREYRWSCLCSCGGRTIAVGQNLKSGNTKSCGCLQRERASVANKIHGGKGLRLYNIWKAMKQRCSDPNAINYGHYGARGIKVCDEWLHNFAAFRDWAISAGYTEQSTIDRIERDGNYDPGNCQWLSRGENTAKGNRQRRMR